MKKNEKRKLWKQGLGTALICGLAVAVFPAAKADAADLLKAGPINTTAEHVTQKQPFAEGTAGSQYFRIPAFIVTQKGNLLAAADARYSTTDAGNRLNTIAPESKKLMILCLVFIFILPSLENRQYQKNSFA